MITGFILYFTQNHIIISHERRLGNARNFRFWWYAIEFTLVMYYYMTKAFQSKFNMITVLTQKIRDKQWKLMSFGVSSLILINTKKTSGSPRDSLRNVP